MQNLETFISSIPEYAKDIKINLQTLLNSENQTLNVKQVFGCALASAYTTKEKTLIKIMENEAQKFLSEIELKATKTSAVLMAMNNIYYRFSHLTEDKEYSQMHAGLRMKGIIEHGINKVDFEAFSLAVSVVNGCGMCIDAHANQLLKNSFSKTQVQMIAKIASVVNAAAQILLIEKE